jgi:hypothetical protein
MIIIMMIMIMMIMEIGLMARGTRPFTPVAVT